jgi:ABC-2 type transport system ATP-binding protein
MNARFREVRVVLNGEPVLPPSLPQTWLNVTVSGNVLTFIDSAYDEAALAANLAALFGEIRHIDVQPAGLRAVFTALVRSSRKPGNRGQQ